MYSATPVSYTHLDVYKRQGFGPLTNGSNLLYGFTSFASFNLSLGGTTLHLETVMQMCIRDSNSGGRTRYVLVWEKDGISHTIIGKIPREEILKIAESIS